MTQGFLRFQARGRAIWAPCLAFVLLGVVPLTLVGCSDATAPEAAGDLEKFSTATALPAVTGDAVLAVSAPGFGRWLVTGDTDTYVVPVDPGQSVQFFWKTADATALSPTVKFRYGWNVYHPDDPSDRGWFGVPSSGYKSQQTQPREFWAGSNFLTIERWDGDRLQVRAVFEVWVPPVAP